MFAEGPRFISLILPLILVAGAAAQSPDSAPPEKKLPLPGEVFRVDGRTAFVIRPEKSETQSADARTPWVWYAPTLPNLPGPEERWMFEHFLKAGIAIAGIDVGESYGSPAGRKGYAALYRELTEKRGFAAKPVLLGRSRGGLMTLGWAVDNADKVGGFAGIYPVCNVASYPGVAQASGAYGMKPDEFAAKLAEFNPIDRLESLGKSRVPMFAIHGDVDKVVPLEANSGEVKKRYQALGGDMQLVVPQGQGHNMWSGFFQCQELVDFVVKNARAAEPQEQPRAATDPKAAEAVRGGIGYLSKQQQADGSWKIDIGNYQDGASALCALAMCDGGVDRQDERMQRAVRWLRGRDPQMTYSLVLQTLVFCRARAPEDVERIQRNVAWLTEAQCKEGGGKGGWSYARAAGGRGDGSCTRFAIWALDAARRAGAKVPESVWRANAEYWLASQLEDGAWAYTPDGKSGTVTMTLAGIYCLAAIKDAVADPPLHARIDQAIERAWKRHDKWCENSQPSYLKSHAFRYYAFQLLGQAAARSGHPKIGEVEWKPAAIQFLLSQRQADSGIWQGEMGLGGAQPLISSSLAILFLTDK